MKNLKIYFFSVLVFAAMSLNATPAVSFRFESSSESEMLIPPPTTEDAADYVQDQGHDVYLVQPIQGSVNFRAYVEYGHIVTVYVLNNRIIGHSDDF